MSWFDTLYKTYEENIEKTNIEDKSLGLLLPISHSTQNAQIEITLNIKGDFIRAVKVDKDDAVTIIPVTEDSAARSSGSAPHPLCDKLKYIAKDLPLYTRDNSTHKFYEDYVKGLRSWCESEYAHEKATAVLAYIEKGSVIKDLLNEKVLELDEKGILSDKINKMQTSIVQAEAFVRFSVKKPGARGVFAEVWKDTELMERYIQYYNSTKDTKDLCCVTGKIVDCSDKHPAKIRNTGDKSKLISANQAYAYEGRFENKSEPVSIGYETSQKAHNALRWLIQRQGYTRGEVAIVAWANGAGRIDIPNPFADSESMIAGESPNSGEESIPETAEVGNEAEASADEPTEDRDDNGSISVAQRFALRLKEAIKGNYSDLENVNTKIVVMGVEAATTGRLSIIYYRELAGSEFLQRVLDWHMQCTWSHLYKKKDDKYYRFLGAPAPYDIALAAFGTEQNGILKAGDKLITSTIERLLPCIVDGRNVPFDIVRAVVARAGRPTAMSGFNHQKVLGIACSLIKKYRWDRYKEEWKMTLYQNEKKQDEDRSYIFGRLLAIADHIEYRTFKKDEKRETNAKRYWEVFSKRPAKTLELLNRKLLPYLSKLPDEEKEYYEKVISEIFPVDLYDEFNDELRKIYNNNPLNETYILGFWTQSRALKGYAREFDKRIRTQDSDVTDK